MIKSKEQIIGLVMSGIIAIWGIILIVIIIKIGSIETIEKIKDLESFMRFAYKVASCVIPILIGALAMIPILNEDNPIVSYISFGVAIIALVLISFSDDGLSNQFIKNILYGDILILIVFAVRSSSSMHLIYKIVLSIFLLITVFVLLPVSSDKEEKENQEMDYSTSYISSSEYGDISITSSPSAKQSNSDPVTDAISKIAMGVVSLIGIMLNPGIALISDDGSFFIKGMGVSTNPNERTESPIEMYNRLLAENANQPMPQVNPQMMEQMQQMMQQMQQQMQQSAPAKPAASAPAVPASAPTASTSAPAAPAQPDANKPVIGPNSGAVINPIPPAQSNPAPESKSENFEVPAGMAFLFDNNDQNKGNGN